jgi:hypothetical protein
MDWLVFLYRSDPHSRFHSRKTERSCIFGALAVRSYHTGIGGHLLPTRKHQGIARDGLGSVRLAADTIAEHHGHQNQEIEWYPGRMSPKEIDR